MHGNVFEWCGDKVGGVCALRGGSWFYRARYCRSAYRYGHPPDTVPTGSYGFRVLFRGVGPGSGA